MSEVSTPEPAGQPPGRAAHVISQVYYYLAAVVGFGLFLGGAIGALFGVRALVLPREFDTARDAVRSILHGLSFALPGLALMLWHLREARRREDAPPTNVFWGRTLYFHLMALVALIFLLVGGIGVLRSAADYATARCDRSTSAASTAVVAETDPLAPPDVHFVGACYPSRQDALRSAVDASIFLIVAGPVFWWHLRQGRRTTAPHTS